MNTIARAGLVALTGDGLALTAAAPAVAAPAPGACPPQFMKSLVDEESGQILAFDKNGDSWVCVLILRIGYLYVIDN